MQDSVVLVLPQRRTLRPLGVHFDFKASFELFERPARIGLDHLVKRHDHAAIDALFDQCFWQTACDIGQTAHFCERRNLCLERPEIVQELKGLLEQSKARGRSAP